MKILKTFLFSAGMGLTQSPGIAPVSQNIAASTFELVPSKGELPWGDLSFNQRGHLFQQITIPSIPVSSMVSELQVPPSSTLNLWHSFKSKRGGVGAGFLLWALGAVLNQKNKFIELSPERKELFDQVLGLMNEYEGNRKAVALSLGVKLRTIKHYLDVAKKAEHALGDWQGKKGVRYTKEDRFKRYDRILDFMNQFQGDRKKVREAAGVGVSLLRMAINKAHEEGHSLGGWKNKGWKRFGRERTISDDELLNLMQDSDGQRKTVAKKARIAESTLTWRVIQAKRSGHVLGVYFGRKSPKKINSSIKVKASLTYSQTARPMKFFDYLLGLMEAHQGDIRKVAKLAGISARQLGKRIIISKKSQHPLGNWVGKGLLKVSAKKPEDKKKIKRMPPKLKSTPTPKIKTQSKPKPKTKIKPQSKSVCEDYILEAVLKRNHYVLEWAAQDLDEDETLLKKQFQEAQKSPSSILSNVLLYGPDEVGVAPHVNWVSVKEYFNDHGGEIEKTALYFGISMGRMYWWVQEKYK